MGQAQSDGAHFQDVRVRDQFTAIQTLWGDDDLSCLLDRLKDMTLNFSLDRVKFARLLQLSNSYEGLIGQWFEDFSHDRASQVVDGLEFLSAAIMVSSKVALSRKVSLLFELFDLDRTGCVRRDEFTIFLKAAQTGLQRVCLGLPPAGSVVELGGLSAELFAAGGPLSAERFLAWLTESHAALRYLSCFSRLGTCVFGWGESGRGQLGLGLARPGQPLPVPLLALEGVRVRAVASHESHALFLSDEGRVWSCGSGFCGILGHGDREDARKPRPVEALQHARVVAVAAGARHSAAVSDRGQVFTWGAADMGQLGHGSTEDREVHEWVHDPRTGGEFAFVSRPTVVMGLFGKRICAQSASCCHFSTCVLTDQGQVYSWGNNTDGQCGQGQKCPEHRLLYLEPHLPRTAVQAILEPRRVEAPVAFRALACGGHHSLAVDVESRVWSWGQGLWGKLGHGDQRSMYEPKLVAHLRHQACLEVSAGEAHSLCLLSLYRLTITGGAPGRELSPFSLLGLPLGRVERDMVARRQQSPPHTSLQFNAFACARLVQVGLAFHEPEAPGAQPVEASVAMLDRGLWEGCWLKLSTSDFDFRVWLCEGSPKPQRQGLRGRVLFAAEGRWEPSDCQGRICALEELSRHEGEGLRAAARELAERCGDAGASCCLLVLPKGLRELPELEAPQGLVLGLLSHEHGMALKKHVAKLVAQQLAGGEPEEVRDWRECREDFTGRPYFEHTETRQRRRAPPQVEPGTEGLLVHVREDNFLQRLKAVLARHPQAVIVCQQSWRPDVELAQLPEPLLEHLEVPVVMVTYEAGEELKGVAASGAEPWVSMELQPFGGVCAWGEGTSGQLGLAEIENQAPLQSTRNVLTDEESSFCDRPAYVAHLHEHQVVSLACGAAHTVAATQPGEVFAWGAAGALGVPPEEGRDSGVPVFVEQLEGLVTCRKAFAGHRHSFVLAEMPFRPVV